MLSDDGGQLAEQLIGAGKRRPRRFADRLDAKRTETDRVMLAKDVKSSGRGVRTAQRLGDEQRIA